MAGNPPPQITVAKALNYLKSGQYIPALKYLHYLYRNSSILSQREQKEIFENYQICLKILFDRQLVAVENALREGDELMTSLLLIDLMDLQANLFKLNTNIDRNLQKNFEKSFKLFETWVFKVLTNIRSYELKKRHLERHYIEILNLFGYSSKLYTDFLCKNATIDHFFQPNISEFEKICDSIFRELTSFFFIQLEESIDQNEYTQILEFQQSIKIALKRILNDKRFEQQFGKIELRITEKLAELDLYQGAKLEDQGDYFESSQKFRAAFKKYARIGNSSQSKKAKTKFLEVTVLLGKSFEEKAENAESFANPQKYLHYFQKAKQIYQDINAKKELKEIDQKIRQYYENLGDFAYTEAKELPEETVHEISKKLFKYNEIKHHFEKADNTKKIKKILSEIDKLHKLQYKNLTVLIIEAQKAKDYDKEYLFLEDLHLLSYEMNNEKNIQKIARELEKLKPKVNFGRLDDLKQKRLQRNKNLTQKQNNNGPNIDLQLKFNDESSTSFILNEENMENQNSNFPNVQNNPFIEETWFIGHQKSNPVDMNNQETRIISQEKINKSLQIQNSQQNTSLKMIYTYIKKHNEGQILSKNEINFLFTHGINLPANILYYYHFSTISHQFYAYENPQGGPQVLMIPRTPLIVRRKRLGETVINLQKYINGSKVLSILPQDIILNHCKFAQISNNWEDYLASFQYSSLYVYVNFLQAIRLLNQDGSISEIVKWFNSSLIAEFINLPSTDMIEFLQKFSSLFFVEEYVSLSNEPNFILFALGIKYFFAQNQALASTFWSMLDVS